MITKLILLSTISILMISSTHFVYAGGAREDWSDKYDDIPGAPECWVDGYDDGQNNPFSQDRHKECLFDVEQSDSELCCNGRPYYEGFMYGCMDTGNTEEICDKFTD
ncbi:MAG: hypothetical protein WAU25_10375 [Nitrososphaeraceae archaeon]